MYDTGSGPVPVPCCRQPEQLPLGPGRVRGPDHPPGRRIGSARSRRVTPGRHAARIQSSPGGHSTPELTPRRLPSHWQAEADRASQVPKFRPAAKFRGRRGRLSHWPTGPVASGPPGRRTAPGVTMPRAVPPGQARWPVTVRPGSGPGCDRAAGLGPVTEPGR
eukprot:33290-Hanusia_phi.AAC.1